MRLHKFSFFLCPSDTGDRLDSATCDVGDWWRDAGRTNYRGNGGSDTSQSIVVGSSAGGSSVDYREKNNGMFLTNRAVSHKHVTDGSTHTALYSEKVLGDGDRQATEVPGDWLKISGNGQTADVVYNKCTAITTPWLYTGAVQYPCSGRNWVHGDYGTTRYNHVMLPNALSCSQQAGGGNLTATHINEDGSATTASSRHNGGVNLVCVDGGTHFISDDIDRLVWIALGWRDCGEAESPSF